MLKLNSLGNLLWSRGYNSQNSLSSGYFNASVVQSDDSGFVLISTIPILWNGSNDIIAIKTDSLGNQIWSQSYGGTYFDFGLTIIKTKPTGYLILGISNSFGFFSKIIFKINDAGLVQWSRLIGNDLPYPAYGKPVAQTSDFGFVFFGEQAAENKRPICKTDSSGNLIWSKIYSSSFDVILSSIIETSDGKIAITGMLQDSNVTHSFIAKLDSMGNPVWTEYYNDSLDCSSWATTLEQTYDGGFAFSGGHNCLTTDNYLLLVKTDSLGNVSCSGAPIPAFQSTSYNNPDSVVILPSTFLGLPDSSVSSPILNSFYTESSFCFAPIYTTVREPEKNSVNLFPNPFHANATLKLENEKWFEPGNCELKIYNSIGVLIRVEKISNTHSYTLDRIGLNDGLYFYELRTLNYELIGTGKFIVE
jgi:hypothetical protein